MEVRNSNFAAFIDVFTSNTYVMVIMSDPSIRKYSSLVNPLMSATSNNAAPPVFIFQRLQPLSSISVMLGNTLRSWSGWMDPSTACTCGCASPFASLPQPISWQTERRRHATVLQLPQIRAAFLLYPHIQSVVMGKKYFSLIFSLSEVFQWEKKCSNLIY